MNQVDSDARGLSIAAIAAEQNREQLKQALSEETANKKTATKGSTREHRQPEKVSSPASAESRVMKTEKLFSSVKLGARDTTFSVAMPEPRDVMR